MCKENKIYATFDTSVFHIIIQIRNIPVGGRKTIREVLSSLKQDAFQNGTLQEHLPKKASFHRKQL